jgi:hypothetical protein
VQDEAGKFPGLRIAPLSLRLETVGPFRAPEFKGALFRGGLGQFFREMVCTTRLPVCKGCSEVGTCGYSTVFETPVIPERLSVLRKYPNAPHPFVLTPPLDGRTTIPAGASMELGLTLIGDGIEHLPDFVAVFDAMGRSGRYGGPFRVRSVVGAEEPARMVYDGDTRRLVGEPPLWRPSATTGAVRRLDLEFVTPLRIRTDGRYNSRPGFVALTHALLRRVHLLNAVHGDGDAAAVWMYPLLRQADQVKTERADFQLYAWDRMSGRQGRRVQMDGVLGRLTAAGELTELAPYFEAGVWLQVGSGTSMGLGKYVVRFEREAEGGGQ